MLRAFLALFIAQFLTAPLWAGELIKLREMDARVAAIAHRLAVASADICADKAPLSGLLIQDVGQYAPEWRDEARADLRLSDVPTVTVVVPGSAAAKAGVQVGDRILAMDGIRTPRSPVDGRASYAVVEASLLQLGKALEDGTVSLAVERNGAPVTLTIAGERACPANVELIPGKRMSASADGKTVHVSAALATFAGSDDAVAVPIAHEMAHNILRHPQRLDAKGVRRGLLAPFGKNRTEIRATEEEADVFAAYMLARAGYDLDAALDFWRRYGTKTDLGPFNDGTHPGKKARLDLARRTVAEIRDKQAAGRPLVPTLVEQD